MGMFYTRSKPKRKKQTPKQLRDIEDAKASAKELKAKWDKEQSFSSRNTGTVLKGIKVKDGPREGPPKLINPPGRVRQTIPSLVTPGGDAVKKPDKVYTGTKMLGVATMHKSNGVAVFSDEHLVDIANMRRNDYTRDVKKKPNEDAGILPPSDEW